MEGVQNQTTATSGKRRSIKVNVAVNDLERVKNVCRQMPQKVRSSFNGRYGQMLDLLHISVEKAALSALAQFWRSDFRCFELPNLDIVPTLEEYKLIMGLPIEEHAEVYIYGGSYVDEKKIAHVIGMPANQFILERKGAVRSIKKAVLENHLENLAQKEKWAYFSKTLALIIFGLVLFPFTVDFVDQAAMDVFIQYEEQGADPVPAILGDTLLSMEICHEMKGGEKKGGTLRCCSHLLYVWIITHVHSRDHLGPLSNPLRDFAKIPRKAQEVGEWKNEFASTELETFRWVCPWYHPNKVIFRCGDFDNVPLMGPRGCVAYTPVIALLQLKRTQVTPSYEQLGGLSFMYNKEGTKDHEARVKKAWSSVHEKGDDLLGKPRLTASTKYREWRAARGVQSCMPKVEPVPQRTSREIASMISQIEALKTQVIYLKEKKDQHKVKAMRVQHQYEEQGKEIVQLKKDRGDDYRELKRARSTTFMLKRSQEKVETFETKLKKVLEERVQLKTEIRAMEQHMEKLKEELTEIRGYDDKSWPLFRKYQEKGMTSPKLRKLQEEIAMREVTIGKISKEKEKMKKEIEKLTIEKEHWKFDAHNSQCRTRQ